jgi:hypothetical protein
MPPKNDIVNNDEEMKHFKELHEEMKRAHELRLLIEKIAPKKKARTPKGGVAKTSKKKGTTRLEQISKTLARTDFILARIDESKKTKEGESAGEK